MWYGSTALGCTACLEARWYPGRRMAAAQLQFDFDYDSIGKCAGDTFLYNTGTECCTRVSGQRQSALNKINILWGRHGSGAEFDVDVMNKPV